MQTQAKDYWKLFKPSACNLRLKGANQEAVFEELVENFVKAKLLSESLRRSAVQAYLERENLASTGVGQSVAIPHVKLLGIEEAVFGLSLHPAGVNWSALDGAPVHLFFAVLRPARPSDRFDPDRHLDMMRWISSLVREADFRRFARQVSKRSDLVELLREMSAG